MKNKIKKWHIALMSFMALFIAVFASMFSLRADTVDEETGEVLTDNWKFDIVFYDSSIDNGKTPLTEINWDASDGGYLEGEPRIITVQINYKNNSAVTTYQPGELQITLDRLFTTTKYNFGWGKQITSSEFFTYFNVKTAVGANDSTHTGYDWDVINTSSEQWIFSNVDIIEEKANFEGSIQVQYTIIPAEYTHKYDNQSYCSLTKTIKANILDIVESNTITFNFERTLIHPWIYQTYTITKKASKITSFDTLGNNADNYIWVRYDFTVLEDYSDRYESYPYICASNLNVKDSFPSSCVVYNVKGESVPHKDYIYDLDNSTIIRNYNTSGRDGTDRAIYVGYPKTEYNESLGNLNITNTVYLYGTYKNKTDEELLSTDDVSLNLANFEFSYAGNLYGINKTYPSYAADLRYQDIINNWSYNNAGWYLQPVAYYTGTPMTVKIGDDLLYATDINGNYVKLDDNEYYFTNLYFPYLMNGNGTTIAAGKYNCELWIRYENETEYILYDEFTNNNQSSTSTSNPNQWNFSSLDKKVVGFYVIIKDMTESLTMPTNNSGMTVTTKFIKTNIPESGTLYNFGYIQVYFKDENGNLVLQNKPTIDNYANLITKDEIAEFDQDTYGIYMQRSSHYRKWSYYNVPQIKNGISARKTATEVIQNAKDEIFTGSFSIRSCIVLGENFSSNYINDYNQESLVDGWEIHDLLPKGLKLTSSKEEILNSLKIINTYYNSGLVSDLNSATSFSWGNIYSRDGVKISPKEFYEIVKNNTTITIVENWNDTERTKITIRTDLSNSPLFIVGGTNYSIGTHYTYNYSLSYDSFMDYGSVYTNYQYTNFINASSYKVSQSTPSTNAGNYGIGTTTKDTGILDPEAVDINENKITNESLAVSETTIIINSLISTHQDVTTFVQSNLYDYSTGIVDSSCDSEYKYKLRVRTGSADITNLVIYTSIEEAQPNRTRWKGEFLGIDTYRATEKGYSIKVWYSENLVVGTLTEDNSWKEYNESVDKNNVKSLAFQYLDNNGNAATLPANSLTYVLIKMKSPADENETRLARMDCWTQWNAIDEFDQPVDFITGINSNVVKVALPNSVKTDDLPSISLKFTKEIQGETTDFENLKLNKADEHIFMIRLTSLTANDDGSYNQVTGLLSSTQRLVITQIPIGTYLLEELGDNYFDFVEFTNNNDPEIVIEGVTFEKTDQGYIITVSEDLAETVEFNIKVTNKTEDERFYEEKHNKENLFLINKTGIDHNVPEE